MKLKSKGIINLDINGEIYDYKLYQSLNSLAKTGSQRKSAKELNISHTVFNRRLLKAEDKLGVKITQKQGNGTLLTPEGEALLEEYKKYLIQIDKTSEINICGGHISTGLLESIDTTFNTNIYSSNDEDAKNGKEDIRKITNAFLKLNREKEFQIIAVLWLQSEILFLFVNTTRNKFCLDMVRARNENA